MNLLDSGTQLVILLLFLGGLLILPVVANCILDMMNGNDGGHARRMQDFHDERRAQGVSFSDRMDELFLREVMAAFRREASDLVRRDPTIWLESINKAQQDAFNKVAERDKSLLAAFGGMIRGLSYGHILYEDECRMVDRLMSGHCGPAPNQDQIAALRIVRPN